MKRIHLDTAVAIQCCIHIISEGAAKKLLITGGGDAKESSRVLMGEG